MMKKNKNLPKTVSTRKKKQEVAPPIATSDEMQKLIKTVAVVTVIFLTIYGITILLTKDKKATPEKTEVKIQDEDILLGNLLEQNEAIYFVLVTVEDDDYKNLYNTYVEKNNQSPIAPTIYTSNLSNSFNLKYKATESKTNITNINELKLKGSTLLEISNKKIVQVYEGKENIVSGLKAAIGIVD